MRRFSLLSKLFLLLLSAAIGTPALSEPPIEMRVRSFADIDNTLLFKRRSPLPPHPMGSSADFILNTPQQILLLIDIDDTTLRGARKSTGTTPCCEHLSVY